MKPENISLICLLLSVIIIVCVMIFGIPDNNTVAGILFLLTAFLLLPTVIKAKL